MHRLKNSCGTSPATAFIDSWNPAVQALPRDRKGDLYTAVTPHAAGLDLRNARQGTFEFQLRIVPYSDTMSVPLPLRVCNPLVTPALAGDRRDLRCGHGHGAAADQRLHVVVHEVRGDQDLHSRIGGNCEETSWRKYSWLIQNAASTSSPSSLSRLT